MFAKMRQAQTSPSIRVVPANRDDYSMGPETPAIGGFSGNQAALRRAGDGRLIQRKLSVGSIHDPLEVEADQMAARLARHSASGTPPLSNASKANLQASEAPAVVEQAMTASGRPLDHAARSQFEARFGRDFGGVRVHTDPAAAVAADAISANAFTMGQEIFFAAGRFDPHTREGQRLLAHELTHTVQQAGAEAGNRSSAAQSCVYRDPVQKPAGGASAQSSAPTVGNDSKSLTLDLSPDIALWLQIHFLKIPDVQLTPPSILSQSSQPSIYSPPPLSLSSGFSSGIAPYSPSASLMGAQMPNLFPTMPQIPTTPAVPSLTPTPSPGSGQATAAPSAPDRLSLWDSGPISLGARIGFPSPPQLLQPDGSPSALQESLRKGEILNSLISGKPPSMPAPDPGKLVGALWGIFSTKIAPGYAAWLASKMSSKPSSGVGVQLDVTLLLSLPKVNGAGATLTITFP